MIDVITLTGGLPRDAELRFTPQGSAVANFTLAASDGRYGQDQNKWVSTRNLYLDVTIWNEPGNKENPTPWAEMAANLKKGDQVAVTGKLITRSWETKEGDKRSKVEFHAYRYYTLPAASQQQPSQAQQQWQQAAHNGQTAQSGAWGNPAPVGQGEPPF